MDDLKDMNIIVTGGASGIGRATALLLAEHGARVFVGDIDAVGGRRIAEEAAGKRLAIEFAPLDLTDAASAEAFVAGVRQVVPRIDGLVNAAGWDKVEPFMENDPKLWDKLLAINLLGPIRLTRHVLTHMTEAKGGKIVNISSDAGRVGSMGEAVYSACKGGTIAFTKALAREMARYKINVNCVCPGPTDTPLLQAQTSEWAMRIKEGMTRAVPFRRMAEPVEIAESIAFFLSARSAFVTGQVLSVSGGLTMAG
jgi:2-hydroxycyclohexanecarboxyl-CoA dehydrogenase